MNEKSGPRPPRHLHSVQPVGLAARARAEGAAAHGDVAVYDQDGAVVVLLRGTIDIGQAQELEEAGGYAIEKQIPILVDVRHVEMIDSVGISFLVRVAASIRSHGRTITLCGPAPLVEEMLSVAGAAPLFTWVEGRPGPSGMATP
ncbi:STAS domain-containing protein [Kineosporia sp. J2-2]|uniref:STAS domain-containing protein n=1 Tax=Kineosporia corallincola TaxID=2835133 RepID=A0ABS5TAC0_9ACTN|nr:STAS domain-containing protein [Kineosporia corallincola]MBT0767813.1 STAS domain-containing protein [Kineosporia corallincola]